VSVAARESPSKPRERAGRPYDAAARNRAQRKPRYRGVTVYIPADVLEAAGIDPDDGQPIFYRLAGYRRSRNGHSVIVSLYREP
jgi:hypothetical protein